MKDKTYLLNTVLAVLLGVILLAAVIVRVFMPIIIIPTPDVPDMVLLSLLALLAEHYVTGRAKRSYGVIFLLAAVTFGLLPWAAGFAEVGEIWKNALAGGIIFTVTTWVFTSIQERMLSGAASKAAPVVNALGIYLAAQCLVGIFL